ncbi:MAG: 50S ribosomal protein L3 [Patescibacteria group bacterium]
MLNSIFATKRSMTQAWDKQGHRLAVTKLAVGSNMVVRKDKVNVKPRSDSPQTQENYIFEIGYGKKKLKNVSKPLRENLKRGGFSLGAKQLKGVRISTEENIELKVGDEIKLDTVLEVGDLVKVQGTSKGKGFAGVMKRHGFSGGPRTHGQSDRERAPGSIGAGTYPGRVWKGKKMPGHMGVETKTVENLVVLHIDVESGELWLSGPIPGSVNSIVKITKMGKKKELELDKKASGIPSTSSGTTKDDKDN